MHWYYLILILPYFILLLDIFRNLLSIKQFNYTRNPLTFVSIIVACRNEQENLPQLLRCITKQDYPHHMFEVIIIDDNSIDKTREAPGTFDGRINIVVISNPGKGKKSALKTGIAAATGELIITTDADCTMGSGWIRTLTAFYEKNKPDMIIGPVMLNRLPGFFGRFQELEFLSLQAVTAGTAVAGNGTICNGANLTFTRDAYNSNSQNLRFDIPTGDDVFLLHSMKRQKSNILWLESPQAIVETKATSDIDSFLSQRKRWASKGTAYKDIYSIILGNVTFVTILSQAGLMVAGFFDHDFFKISLLFFLLKCFPDFLILLNTTTRYERKELMKWFLPTEIVYPFYVVVVVVAVIIKDLSQRLKRPQL